MRSFFIFFLFLLFPLSLSAAEIKPAAVAGAFYPQDPKELSVMIDSFLNKANPPQVDDNILVLLSPHAGYIYSGQTASFGYKLIKDKPYNTVVIIGVSHFFPLKGVSVYAKGAFQTPLGNVNIDEDFTQKLIGVSPLISFIPEAFSKEHSVEVQIPFLQKVLPQARIVPILIGEADFLLCKQLGFLLKNAIGDRKDALVVVSSDLYHGYDYEQAKVADTQTLDYIKSLDPELIYAKLKEGVMQMCGGLPLVTAMVLAKEVGVNSVKILAQTDSAQVTGNFKKNNWVVGYASVAIIRGGSMTLNVQQRKKLISLARNSIEHYLRTRKELEVKEDDPALTRQGGAFVTLRKDGELRGCIGHIVAEGPLYLTIKDMAVEAAVGDPRFPPVQINELSGLEIEISVLSPLKKVASADEIKLGQHGVLVKQGYHSGVFLPQVATETSWSKEEFLSNLCAHKAGLPPQAWKDKLTELYVFTAEVFSERELTE